MKRKFVTNLLLLLLLNILIKPFWIFGIDRTVQNMVGSESYGLYFSLLSFSMLLNILLDLGITNFNNREIARHHQLLPKYLSNLVGLKIILALVYALVSLAIAAIIGYDKVQFHLLALLIVNQFLVSFTLYLRSNISGLHLFKTDSFLSVLDRSLMILFCSVLLFTPILKNQFSISWFVYAQTAAYFVAASIALAVVLIRSGKISLRFDWRFFRVFLRKSYPYALLILLMSFYNRIDSVILERLLPHPIGKEQAGIYAQAFRLLDAFAMFGVLFAGLLLPIFSKMIKQREDVAQMVQFSFLLIIVPSVIVAVSTNFYAFEIMDLLYHQHALHSAQIIGYLMVGLIGISTTYIFGTLLTANGNLRQLNTMALTGMGINIALNLALIPSWQALGSAWASLLTQLVTAFIQIMIAVKVFKLKTNVLLILRLTSFVLGTILIGKICARYMDWPAGYFVLIMGSSFTAFALKLINLKTLVQLFKDE